MLIHHREIGVAAVDVRQLGPGDVGGGDGATDLGLVHVVALLVQAPHGVEHIQQGEDVRRRVEAPAHPQQPDTAVGRHGGEDVLGRDGRGVLHPQGGDGRIGRHGEVRDAALVADGEVGHGCGQVQGLEDAAVGEGQASDGRAVKVGVLQAGAAGDIHRHGEVGAVAHV